MVGCIADLAGVAQINLIIRIVSRLQDIFGLCQATDEHEDDSEEDREENLEDRHTYFPSLQHKILPQQQLHLPEEGHGRRVFSLCNERANGTHST